MAVWMIRAGKHGERQNLALEQGLVLAGWDYMPDLGTYETKEDLRAGLQEHYPKDKPATISNWLGQLRALTKRIQIGDLVLLPLKGQDAIAIGRITGNY
jgi:restriction system protein